MSTQQSADSLGCRKSLTSGGKEYEVYSLSALYAGPDGEKVRSLPLSLRVLLENLLRLDDGSDFARRSIRAWGAGLPMLDGFSTADIRTLVARAVAPENPENSEYSAATAGLSDV